MEKARLRFWLQAAAALVVVALVIGLYRAKSDAAQAEARVRALNAEIAERRAELRELRADIAAQESPANIERLAEQHLGVVPGGESAALSEADIAATLPAPRRPPE